MHPDVNVLEKEVWKLEQEKYDLVNNLDMKEQEIKELKKLNTLLTNEIKGVSIGAELAAEFEKAL